MFRYASRRFGLTLFIAAAVDTLRCVPTPLLPSILHPRSPSSLSLSFYIYIYISLFFLPVLPCRSLFLCFLLFIYSPAALFVLVHTLMHIYIYRLLARRLARIATSAPDAPWSHASYLGRRPTVSLDLFVYCRSTVSSDLYLPRVSVSQRGYAGIAKFFRRSNVASTMLQTIWKPRVSPTLLLYPSRCFHFE